MASRLIRRVQSHKDWIGDDHGDRYEEAMITGVIPDEMQIVVKEILDHLRAALDYCAQHVWAHYSGQPQHAKVYFPIAREAAKEGDFLSLMNKNMPGVASACPAAYDAFKGCQAFADSENSWLPELATLVNQTKHNHLEVASIPPVFMKYATSKDGVLHTSFLPANAPKRGTPWMKVKSHPPAEQNDQVEVVFIQLKDIQVELNTFLSEAIAGATAIVGKCRRLLP